MEAFGEIALAQHYRTADDEIKAGVMNILYRPELGRFARMALRTTDGGWKIDPTLDSSLFALWYFGMLAPDDSRITQTMLAVHERLSIKTTVGGIARYEGDGYHRQTDDAANVPGKFLVHRDVLACTVAHCHGEDQG
ncbi:MAG TPA: hypothetical protein VJV04_10165 [Nitrospiraceae bacterium]|nr:hypothetical protein [Nitrospiraceae bacterium]